MIAPVRLSMLYFGAAIVCLFCIASALVYLTFLDRPDALSVGDSLVRAAGDQSEDALASADDLPLETYLPQQKQALGTAEALAENYARPLSRINPLAPPFLTTWLSEPDRSAATTCLATAIYYESDGEPPSGQRAVAQVVLNRVRNPHYPKTVCDVVYQGAERQTGCQFTFACDGSLARRPAAAGMARARLIADAALSGAASPTAGQATHYHSVWIVPRWAGELLKVAIIGHHVFYRPPKSYGGYAMPSSSADLASPAAAVTMSVDPAGRMVDPGSSGVIVPDPAAAIATAPSPTPPPVEPAKSTQQSVAITPPSAPRSQKTPQVYFPQARRTNPSLAIPTQ